MLENDFDSNKCCSYLAKKHVSVIKPKESIYSMLGKLNLD